VGDKIAAITKIQEEAFNGIEIEEGEEDPPENQETAV
jgi:hypothetical protein